MQVSLRHALLNPTNVCWFVDRYAVQPGSASTVLKLFVCAIWGTVVASKSRFWKAVCPIAGSATRRTGINERKATLDDRFIFFLGVWAGLLLNKWVTNGLKETGALGLPGTSCEGL